jgi:hypothetical protein
MGKDFWLGEKPAEMEMGPMQEMMQQRAQGLGGPSAAELMMNRGMGKQIAAGRSMAAGARGVSPGMAMRQAGRRESQAMSDVGQQTGIMRAQEQAMAQRAALQAELQQAMYNASRVRSGGMLGGMMGMAGQMGSAAIGMPWGRGGGGGGGGGAWGGGYTPYQGTGPNFDDPWAGEYIDESTGLPW